MLGPAADYDAIYNNRFMTRANAPPAFRSWFRTRMMQAVYIDREAVIGGIQDDDGSDDETPLLGGEVQQRDYRRRACALL